MSPLLLRQLGLDGTSAPMQPVSLFSCARDLLVSRWRQSWIWTTRSVSSTIHMEEVGGAGVQAMWALTIKVRGISRNRKGVFYWSSKTIYVYIGTKMANSIHEVVLT